MSLPNPPRLHLNEHLSTRLATQLRKYQFDVTCSQESALLSGTDREQLARAISEQRAIVTFDVGDYMQLHEECLSEGREHWGIVFSTEESLNILLHRLLRLLNSLSADELRNQVRWLNEFK